MSDRRCECGGRLDVEYIHLVIMKAPVDPKTGAWGRGKKVHERHDDGAAPKYICRECKRELFPAMV